MSHLTSQVHGTLTISFMLSLLTIFLSSFITGSYDRTCKVWETASGEELLTLEGHKNVVYSVAFNNPYGYVMVEYNFRFSLSLSLSLSLSVCLSVCLSEEIK